MKVTVMLFARLRERLGQERLEIELEDGATIAALFAALTLRDPAFAADAPHLSAAVNQELAGPDTLLSEADEIAVFPPVGGG